MKKSLLIFFAAVSAGALALLLVTGAVNGERESIRVRETVLSGDAGEAEGIRLEVGFHWDGRLLWETRHQPGRARAAETDFSYSAGGTVWKEEPTDYAAVRRWAEYGTAAAEGKREIDITAEPIALLLQAVAGRTAPGEQRTEILSTGDFYETYPFRFEAVCEEKGVYCTESCSDALIRCFDLRVPDDDLCEITVEKNEEGAVVRFLHRTVSGGYDPGGVCAYGSEGCFFGVYREEAREDGKEGGEAACGIYYLPYRENRKPYSKGYDLDTEKIERVCLLPRGMIPEELVLDEDGGRLYLTARGEGGYEFFVYETQGRGLKERRRLSVLEADGGTLPFYGQMSVGEDGILITWEDNRFVFLAEREGEYGVWCGGIFPGPKEGTKKSAGIYTSLTEESAFCREHAFAFDGRRLALAAFDRWGDLSVRLLVYRDGLPVYSGYYEYSTELDRIFATPERESVQAQGAPTGRQRLAGAVMNPLRVRLP